MSESDSPRFSRFEVPAAERRCARCGVDKPVEEFTFDRDKRCGRGSYCRPCEQERSRDYYQRNRERILARMAARRGPAPVRFCSECRVELEGRQRVVCSSRCRDARFRRLHPEAYAAKEARKVVRRRERRGEAR